MTTPRARTLVSLIAAMAAPLLFGACAGGASRPVAEGPTPAEAPAQAIRFDNLAREHVHVYLVGQRREWLLGRVAPGAVAALRLPEELANDPGFVQLAVLAGGQVSQRAARDVRARLTIAQPASALLARQWRFSQGELTSPTGR
jgi:hypothetical protein